LINSNNVLLMRACHRSYRPAPMSSEKHIRDYFHTP